MKKSIFLLLAFLLTTQSGLLAQYCGYYDDTNGADNTSTNCHAFVEEFYKSWGDFTIRPNVPAINWDTLVERIGLIKLDSDDFANANVIYWPGLVHSAVVYNSNLLYSKTNSNSPYAFHSLDVVGGFSASNLETDEICNFELYKFDRTIGGQGYNWDPACLDPEITTAHYRNYGAPVSMNQPLYSYNNLAAGTYTFSFNAIFYDGRNRAPDVFDGYTNHQYGTGTVNVSINPTIYQPAKLKVRFYTACNEVFEERYYYFYPPSGGGWYKAGNNKEPFATPDFQVYPNPITKGQSLTLNGTLQLEQESTLFVHSLDGKLLDQIRIPVGNNQVDINQLNSGVYLLKLVSEKGTQTQKLLVK